MKVTEEAKTLTVLFTKRAMSLEDAIDTMKQVRTRNVEADEADDAVSKALNKKTQAKPIVSNTYSNVSFFCLFMLNSIIEPCYLAFNSRRRNHNVSAISC